MYVDWDVDVLEALLILEYHDAVMMPSGGPAGRECAAYGGRDLVAALWSGVRLALALCRPIPILLQRCGAVRLARTWRSSPRASDRRFQGVL